MSPDVWIASLYTLGAAMFLGGLFGALREARRLVRDAESIPERERAFDEAWDAGMVECERRAEGPRFETLTPGDVHNLLGGFSEFRVAARELAGLPPAHFGGVDYTGSRGWVRTTRLFFDSVKSDLWWVGIGTIVTTLASIWSLVA